MCFISISNNMYTRETTAFGGISLALRGNGAFGTAFRAPPAPIWRRLRRW